jgi:ribonuclease Z
MRKLVFLGTGTGGPTRSACTSILLETDNSNLLLDTAGGYQVRTNLFESGRHPKNIRNIFISHAHSDHVLGIVPLLRAFKHIKHQVNIICDENTHRRVMLLIEATLDQHWDQIKRNVKFHTIEDGDELEIDGMKMEFIRTDFESVLYGVKIMFKDGFTMFYPGDREIKRSFFDRIQGLDLLIHEAFCLDRDGKKYDVANKHHSTVKQVAKLASQVNAKYLALVHMEDTTLETRKEEYKKEAESEFSREIFVPVDLDELVF